MSDDEKKVAALQSPKVTLVVRFTPKKTHAQRHHADEREVVEPLSNASMKHIFLHLVEKK